MIKKILLALALALTALVPISVVTASSASAVTDSTCRAGYIYNKDRTWSHNQKYSYYQWGSSPDPASAIPKTSTVHMWVKVKYVYCLSRNNYWVVRPHWLLYCWSPEEGGRGHIDYVNFNGLFSTASGSGTINPPYQKVSYQSDMSNCETHSFNNGSDMQHLRVVNKPRWEMKASIFSTNPLPQKTSATWHGTSGSKYDYLQPQWDRRIPR